jgi:hypothetical protein
MLSARKNISKPVTLALALAAAAVFTTAAPAKVDSASYGYVGVTQPNVAYRGAVVPNAAGGGITPTDLARAVPRESNAPAGVTPTDLARAVPRDEVVTTQLTKSAKTDPIWSSTDRDLALGFGFGLALVIVFSFALATSRNRIRIAHP